MILFAQVPDLSYRYGHWCMGLSLVYVNHKSYELVCDYWFPYWEKICAQSACEVEQRTEFNKFIALDARIRRFAAQIFIDEVIFNLIAENLPKIGDKVLYAQKIANIFSIGGGNLIISEQHSNSDDIKAIFEQKSGCERAIYASTHCNG